MEHALFQDLQKVSFDFIMYQQQNLLLTKIRSILHSSCMLILVRTQCYGEFPFLQQHTQNNHGDVCRKTPSGKGGGYRCPKACKMKKGQKPFCMMSRETQKPCRVKSSKYYLLHKYKTKLRIHESFTHKRLALA